MSFDGSCACCRVFARGSVRALLQVAQQVARGRCGYVGGVATCEVCLRVKGGYV